ncbi:MAG: hypothetical protein VR73_07055 [Gammaproteobacteria bacterium BRH_c0]|nr:MAG: hypothetical protein VR73_07055 [Gammaproteobacteria bacterium BRH_c0]
MKSTDAKHSDNKIVGIKLFGIKNCDTVRKARQWLDSQGVKYQYHDFRDDGLSLETIQDWLNRIDSQALLNKRSTTWKNLDEATRSNLAEADIPALLAAHPTLIKRPVLEIGDRLSTGFNEKTWQQLIH